MAATPTGLKYARIGLTLATATVLAAAAARCAGVFPGRTPFLLTDLRWFFFVQFAFLLVVWRLQLRPADTLGARRGPLAPYLLGAAAAGLAAALVYARDINVHLWDSDDWAPMYAFAWASQGNAAERLGRLISDVVIGTRPTGFSDVLIYLIRFCIFSVFGTREWAFHGFALLVHLANCLLVVLLARRLGAGVRAAAAAGLFFALFPPSHEIVTLPAFVNFGLVCTWMLLACVVMPGTGDPGPVKRRAISAVFAVLALLTKETAILMPVIAFLALSVEDGAGPVLTWRRHKGTLAPLAGVVVLYLVAAALFAAFGRRAEMVWNTGTTVSLHAGFWQNPAAVLEALSGTIPVSLFTPITEGLYPRAFSIAGTALAAGLALAAFYLGSAPPPRRMFVPLCAAWVLTAAVAGPLLRYPFAFSEKTHYYYPASVGLALAFGLLFSETYEAPRRGLRRVMVAAAGAALLVFNLNTVFEIVNVRVWFGGVVGRAERVFTREYARLPPGDVVFLVCDSDSLDRGGMEPLIFSNAMKNRLDKPVHLLAHVEFATDAAQAGPAEEKPFVIRAGPRTHMFGWDRAKNDFVELGPPGFLRFVSLQPQRSGTAAPLQRMVFETAEGTWELRGLFHADVSAATINRRM
ncbi:MAG: glycosyltransferase family 39 protein [Deltaproteobacteria bacterium]|nr:glycosyltransferase family 39 protein [Deltaproteobacteria bacterium]